MELWLDRTKSFHARVNDVKCERIDGNICRECTMRLEDSWSTMHHVPLAESIKQRHWMVIKVRMSSVSTAYSTMTAQMGRQLKKSCECQRQYVVE